MRYFVAVLVAAATFATAVVSVKLHLHVAQLRYRLWGLEEDSRRAERELRLARAELEAAKSPRRLMDRWRALRAGGAPAAAAPLAPPAFEAPSVPEILRVEADSAAEVAAAEAAVPAPPPPMPESAVPVPDGVVVPEAP